GSLDSSPDSGNVDASAVDNKIVVGTSSLNQNTGEHAFAYDLNAARPGMIDLGDLGGGSSQAVAIDHKTVVGNSTTSDGETHGFADDLNAPQPALIDLGTLGGSRSQATAIDHKTVVGSSTTATSGNRYHAAVWLLR